MLQRSVIKWENLTPDHFRTLYIQHSSYDRQSESEEKRQRVCDREIVSEQLSQIFLEK